LLELLLGPAMYLLAHALFRQRTARSWSAPRPTPAVLVVLAFALPPRALADLTVLALVLGVPVTWEALRMREVRRLVAVPTAGGH